MGIIKWYKRDPLAALHGMMGLTLEERGAYNTILDLIYAHDGAIDDDPKQICRWLGVNRHKWRHIRSALFDAEKLYLYRGKIRNQRADLEVERGKNMVNNARLNAEKRWTTYNEIKGLPNAVAMLPTPTKISLVSAKAVPNFKKGNR